ncbi:GNAT family N-acetyltransferase [Companilactobacillus sp.]|jgi:phosphinothricin acetyltransferase|uniref:GNAT family N-acetyltransferase n=1 Tax=Companilactobacillus sp. TaxID=2767905 RepID=UPI0025C308BF|nr:GNAT family N-acetyltransferase [Companilactobacillus sp.]MCH4008913.1 GNAT family N-acetyltransferase [Companilactobacillus sp.]MCH4050908.1 GNAT family N-acetyltransferase [Companilactobacillus sp.]MCH4076856.1 GNAT family N-acetyltransferase [Companilactobacillus sp.]MCH4125431.1 GNAT family N-acetyltransferase [Companilactobacillus sp.]MCH4131973.1 GNAT family N-acetyltransferase [Companilactobacillus sp.]
MPIEFNYAEQVDLSKIVDIYNQAIPSRMATADLKPVNLESKQAWFAGFNHQQRPIWKIELDGTIAGWVSLEYFYGRPAYIHTAEISIYIDNNFKHHGLGTSAVEFVITQLKALDIDTLVAYIFSHNLPSQGLFKKYGFTQWAHLPDVALMDGQKRSLDILGKHFN